jgi:hypothetical protein
MPVIYWSYKFMSVSAERVANKLFFVFLCLLDAQSNVPSSLVHLAQKVSTLVLSYSWLSKCCTLVLFLPLAHKELYFCSFLLLAHIVLCLGNFFPLAQQVLFFSPFLLVAHKVLDCSCLIFTVHFAAHFSCTCLDKHESWTCDRGSMHVVAHNDDLFSWKKYNSYNAYWWRQVIKWEKKQKGGGDICMQGKRWASGAFICLIQCSHSVECWTPWYTSRMSRRYSGTSFLQRCRVSNTVRVSWGSWRGRTWLGLPTLSNTLLQGPMEAARGTDILTTFFWAQCLIFSAFLSWVFTVLYRTA